MKPLFIVMALAGTLMTASGASAYHFSGPNPSLGKSERNEFRQVQGGWFPGQPFHRSGNLSVGPAHDVYVNGQYIGSDPDPRIRSGLERDNPQNNGGS